MKLSKVHFLFLALILIAAGCDRSSYTRIPTPDTEGSSSDDDPYPAIATDKDDVPNMGSRPCAYKNGAPLFEIMLTSERPDENRVYVSGYQSQNTPTIHMSCWKDGDKKLWIMTRGLAPAIEDTGAKGKWIKIDMIEKIMGEYVQLRSGDLRFITLFTHDD